MADQQSKSTVNRSIESALITRGSAIRGGAVTSRRDAYILTAINCALCARLNNYTLASLIYHSRVFFERGGSLSKGPVTMRDGTNGEAGEIRRTCICLTSTIDRLMRTIAGH